MQKNQIENIQSTVLSLKEMINETRENNEYNSFVYFMPDNVIFHISSIVMWQIWIRLSEGPWKPNQMRNVSRNLDDDQTIKNDISDFLNNYIYNWKGHRFPVNFSEKQLDKLRIRIIDTFTYNSRFSDYIDKIMTNIDFNLTLSFKLVITLSVFDVLNSYTLIPLKTIYPVS